MASNTKKYSFLLFINDTKQDIEISFFKSTANSGTCCAILKAETELEVIVCNTEPFQAQDAITKTRLHLNGKYLYYPCISSSQSEINVTNRENDMLEFWTFEHIHITFPVVNSLFGMCIEVAAKKIGSKSLIEDLDIPQKFKKALKKYFDEK